jgi:2-polyprenyl-3-methyl-5-hydroxy-6-metoxy-1,4-benzoquinol methylase
LGLPLWDPRKLLELPPVYNLFQKAVGADKGRRRFFEEHIAPLAPARILEIGCGPGTNCQWLPDGIEYVGCDLSEDYIAYARKQFGARARFYATPVGALAKLNLEPFDAVLALAVLHHLSDEQVVTLCEEAGALLKPGGILMTGDPCFTAEQTPLSRFVTKQDRGRFVREPEQYRALLLQRFSPVHATVVYGKLLVIQQPGVLMTAVKE